MVGGGGVNGEGEVSEGREEAGEGVSCGEALVHAAGVSHKAWGECARKG